MKKCKQKFVIGHVLYEDLSPVKNAIVILEAFQTYDASYKFNTCDLPPTLYSTTNYDGEFCFQINNPNCYYIIKIFDNDLENKTKKSSVYMNL